MAMSVEQMNKKLKKVLEDLDKAIEDRDVAKVEKAIQDAGDLNKKSEGKIYEIPIKSDSEQQETGKLQERVYEYINKQLEHRIQEIAEELHPSQGLDDDERLELAQIRKKIFEKKQSFDKIEKAIETLSKDENISQEDLKQYKEQQKEDNLMQIDVMKENIQQMTKSMIDIEMRYVKPIEEYIASKDIIEKIFKKRNTIKNMQKTGIDETVNATMSEIEDLLSKLSSKGIDVSKCQDFQTNLSKLNDLTNQKTALNASISQMISDIKTDPKIPDEWKQKFKDIKGDVDLKNKYKEIVRERQKVTSEIVKLQAENRQIDKTIQMLEREKDTESIAYKEDGTLKSDSQIARIILSNENEKERVNEIIEARKFDSKNPFTRFVAKMNYYKDAQVKETGSKGLKAFFKNVKNNANVFFRALTSDAKDIKMIAAQSVAAYIGKDYANKARVSMQTRQDNFKEAIKNAAAKEISQNPNIKQDRIRDNIREEAYKSALEETDLEIG